jgi:hypothetical protein
MQGQSRMQAANSLLVCRMPEAVQRLLYNNARGPALEGMSGVRFLTDD